VDSHSIREDALYLLMQAGTEQNEKRAISFRYRSTALFAQADHLDETGFYIELPSHIGASIVRGARPWG
jgi:hypothetical protein